MNWAFWRKAEPRETLSREQQLAAQLRRAATKLRSRYDGPDDMFVYRCGFKACHDQANLAEQLAVKLDAGEISYDQAVEEATK